MIDIGRGVKLITRTEWGARAPRSVSSIDPSFGTTCHWEGPHMGAFPHASCATKVQVIQDFHMDTRGWVDIAYTGLVCPHGFVFQGRWLGRRTAANGTTDGNDSAYALCYLGGEGDGFTEAGRVAMRAGLDWLDSHGASSGRNGHRDWKSTACPGDEIYRWVHGGQAAGVIEEDDMFDDEDRDRAKRTLILLRDELLDPDQHAAGRANAKTLVQGAVLDGLRRSESDGDGRGALRPVFKDLLNEVLDEREAAVSSDPAG